MGVPSITPNSTCNRRLASQLALDFFPACYPFRRLALPRSDVRPRVLLVSRFGFSGASPLVLDPTRIPHDECVMTHTLDSPHAPSCFHATCIYALRYIGFFSFLCVPMSQHSSHRKIRSVLSNTSYLPWHFTLNRMLLYAREYS